MQSTALILQIDSEEKICEYFVEILPCIGPKQPIKISDCDESQMQHGGLPNKHFCKNNIQISAKKQQKTAFFYFSHYKSMGSLSCHSNQSS